jgi:nitrogen fixation NifU-like protein
MTEDDLEKLLEELQQKIEYDEEETYSKVVIEEYRNPSNFGVLKNPDAFGEIKGPCGDTMKIGLKIKDLVITDARFWTDGCGATIACGSMLTKKIKGKKLQDVKKITSSELLIALDGLPVEHQHCTILAINTLQKAIKKYNGDSSFLEKI